MMNIGFKTKRINLTTVITAIKATLILFVVFFFIFMLLAFPQKTVKGITDGLKLCFSKVIPSLFPFLVLSSYILKSGLSHYLSYPLKKIVAVLFKLPEEAVTVIIMSVIGGYPVGANMIAELYQSKRISEESGRHLLYFCVNPSLSFTLSYVGAIVCKNIKIGIIIYSSIFLSSLIIGSAFRWINKYNNIPVKKHDTYTLNILTSISESITSGAYSMISVASVIIMFSCFKEIISTVIKEPTINALISGATEVTNFLNEFSYLSSIPFISAVLYFGGLCVHLQVLHCILKLKIKYFSFLTVKISGAILSYVITCILLQIFEINKEASTIIANSTYVTSDDIKTSVMLIFMTLTVIISDMALQNRNKRKLLK